MRAWRLWRRPLDESLSLLVLASAEFLDRVVEGFEVEGGFVA